ncbi:MAG: hypothetical protein ACR2HA_07890 [Nocardioides sp.]
MARPDQRRGRRRADPKARGTRPGGSLRIWTWIWFLVSIAGILAVCSAWLTLWFPVEVPGWVPRSGAVLITTTFALALGVRTGGRPLVSGAVALVLTTVAVVTQLPVLLAGATVATAVVGALLGVLATTPAARFSGVIRECLVASLVAVVAAFTAQAYGAPVAVERTEYLVLGLGLVVVLVLVHRLGAGLQGLGRRGTVGIIAGLALLAVGMAYTKALTTWGSPELVGALEDGNAAARDLLGVVPRPIEVLLGFPALAWGVSTRARRRQGWWPCAFGAAGLAGVATSLLDPRVSVVEAGLTLAYGVALGLVLGYLVIRGDAFLSGNRGARARRAEEAAAHRPEPRRTAPLL